jgi:hypothetical protein
VVHHWGGGVFNLTILSMIGTQIVLECDPNYWSYFSLLATVRRLGYPMIRCLWYHDPYLVDDLIRLMNDHGCRRIQDIAEMNDKVHLYVIHSVDQPNIDNLNPLDEANDFPVPNAGVVWEEIVEDVENVGGEVLEGVPMIEYPVGNVGEKGLNVLIIEYPVGDNEGNVVDDGNAGDMVVNEGNAENMLENE